MKTICTMWMKTGIIPLNIYIFIINTWIHKNEFDEKKSSVVFISSQILLLPKATRPMPSCLLQKEVSQCKSGGKSDTAPNTGILHEWHKIFQGPEKGLSS